MVSFFLNTLQKYFTFHSMNFVHKYLSAFWLHFTHIHLAVLIHLHTILIEALDHVDLALKKYHTLVCLSWGNDDHPEGCDC